MTNSSPQPYNDQRWVTIGHGGGHKHNNYTTTPTHSFITPEWDKAPTMMTAEEATQDITEVTWQQYEDRQDDPTSPLTLFWRGPYILDKDKQTTVWVRCRNSPCNLAMVDLSQNHRRRQQ